MSEVLTETRDGVLIVTLNRPEAKNAANRALAEGVVAAMDMLDDWDEQRVYDGIGAIYDLLSSEDSKQSKNTPHTVVSNDT